MQINKELAQIAKADQDDRTKYWAGTLMESELLKNDIIRLKQVKNLLKSGKIISAQDHRNAAIVFQHGKNEKNERELEASELAVEMMQKAIELDPKSDKWLLAAAIDRNLMIKNEPQIYGTQYIRKDENAPWEFYKFDGSKISDEERKIYRVATIQEQKEKLVRMNLKKLLAKYQSENNINSLIQFCKENYQQDSAYDLSWEGISQFGFQLKRLDKLEDAIKIFELNIELYHKEYDVFHTLGLEYINLNRKIEGIKLLEKAVELNPDFLLGKSDLERYKSENN